jgi:hypothetical protein
MPKKVLQPVVDPRPGILYRAVALRPSQNNRYNDVQFIDSISQGPVTTDQIRKLRAAGPLIHVYPYYQSLEVTWPNGAEKPHEVTALVAGRPASKPKPKVAAKGKGK